MLHELQAEKRMIEAEENKEYLPIEGLADFRKATLQLLLGSGHPAVKEVSCCLVSTASSLWHKQCTCACHRLQYALCRYHDNVPLINLEIPFCYLGMLIQPSWHMYDSHRQGSSQVSQAIPDKVPALPCRTELHVSSPSLALDL